MLLVVAAVGAAACRVNAAPSQEFEPTTVPMQVMQVAPHSDHVLGQAGMVSGANQGFNSNAGFVVVFDALGTPALGKRLSDLIANTTTQPVRRVVVSHYHADHFYGVQAFKRSGVEVWAHEAVRGYLATEAPATRLAERKRSLFPWVNDATRIIAPDRFVGEDTSFKDGWADLSRDACRPPERPRVAGGCVRLFIVGSVPF